MDGWITDKLYLTSSFMFKSLVSIVLFVQCFLS